MKFLYLAGIFLSVISFAEPLQADHFARGLPSFSLDKNNGKLAHMKIDTQIGDYQVMFMSSPAFLQRGEAADLQIFVNRMDSKTPFKGEIRLLSSEGWFGETTLLGSSATGTGHFKVSHAFANEGNYTVIAELRSDSVVNRLTFPLRVGNPVRFTPLILSLLLIAITLVGVNVTQYYRIRKGVPS